MFLKTSLRVPVLEEEPAIGSLKILMTWQLKFWKVRMGSLLGEPQFWPGEVPVQPNSNLAHHPSGLQRGATVQQWTGGGQSISLSYSPLALSSLFLFPIFLLYFLYFDTSCIRTPERCYSSAMVRRRSVRLSLIPPSSSLFSLSFFCFSPALHLLWHIMHTYSREVLQFSNGQEEVSPSIIPPSSSLFSLSFFYLSLVLPLLWHITHPDSREVLQFSNGQEEVSPSISHIPSSSLFSLSFFCLSPYFLSWAHHPSGLQRGATVQQWSGGG